MIGFEWDPAKATANLRKHRVRCETYDLPQLLKGGVQGKYAKRYREGTNLVLLEPDVAAEFPTEEAVNEALRLVIRLRELPGDLRRGSAK